MEETLIPDCLSEAQIKPSHAPVNRKLISDLPAGFHLMGETEPRMDWCPPSSNVGPPVLPGEVPSLGEPELSRRQRRGGGKLCGFGASSGNVWKMGTRTVPTLGACDRSCDPRKGVPSQEGTACCGTRGHGSAGEQLGLVLSESFSSPKDSMSQDLSPSTSLCLRVRHSEGPRACSVCAGVLGTAKRQ